MSKKRKSGPRSNWREYVRNRETICNLLNQIAHGTEKECIHMVARYGGSDAFGIILWETARDIMPESRNGR